MQNKPTDTNHVSTDSMTEQVDQMSRLICDGAVTETRPEPQAAAGEIECVVDFKQLIRRIVDEDLVEQVMPVCINDNRRRLEMLAEGVSNNDAERVKTCAHSIKGTAANVGAARLSDPAARLEQLASEGDLSQAKELLQRIRTEFEKLEAFVANPNWIDVAKNQPAKG